MHGEVFQLFERRIQEVRYVDSFTHKDISGVNNRRFGTSMVIRYGYGKTLFGVIGKRLCGISRAGKRRRSLKSVASGHPADLFIQSDS